MSNEARKECGQRLQAAREERGLTQEALGALVGGVDQVTVSRWENGLRMPSIEHRILLRDLFGFDPFSLEAVA